MQEVVKYLRWEIAREGVCITRRNEEYQGELEVPTLTDGLPVVAISAG